MDSRCQRRQRPTDPLLPPRRGRRGRRRRADAHACSTGCARTRAAPAPRKAAPKATAAPARSSSASSTATARVAARSRSTPASASCPRSTARRCSPSRTTCAASAADRRRCTRCSRRWSTATARSAASARRFVMSLWACYERHRDAGTRPTRQQLADDLSGNLCRCTGYRPILDAGAAHVRRCRRRRALDRAALADDAATLRAVAAAALRAARRRRRFHAPRTLADLAALRAATPRGAAARRQHRHRPVGHQAVPRPRRAASTSARSPSCGASTSSRRPARASAPRRRSKTPGARWSPNGRRCARSGCASPSLPIRNAGTMGGNVANGSPIGDSRAGADRARRDAACCAAASACARCRSRTSTLGYHEEPRSSPASSSRRSRCRCRGAGAAGARLQDLQALRLRHLGGLRGAGDRARRRRASPTARLAFGGMAATVRRAARRRGRAASASRGPKPRCRPRWQRWRSDFTPLTDMRASAGYRLQVAQNLLRRFWLETRADDAAGRERRQRLGRAERDRMNKPRRTAVDAPLHRRRPQVGVGRAARVGAPARRRRRALHRRPARSWPARCMRRSACRRWRTA